jgi:hypothetical protein
VCFPVQTASFACGFDANISINFTAKAPGLSGERAAGNGRKAAKDHRTILMRVGRTSAASVGMWRHARTGALLLAVRYLGNVGASFGGKI